MGTSGRPSERRNVLAMSHLIIVTLVLNLMAGTWVFLYALSSYRKHRRPFLRTLLAYILSFNGLVVVYLSYQYILINVFRGDIARVLDYPVLFSILLFLVFCAEFGIAFNLFRLTRHLRGRRVSAVARGLFVLWAAVFGTLSAWGVARFYKNHLDQSFYNIHAAWMLSVILIILSALAVALAKSRKEGQDGHLRRSFARIFLAGYAAFAFSSLDFYLLHTGIQRYYDPFLLLLINLCPLLWLKAFFEKESPALAAGEFDEGRFDRFCEKYGISKREREIIQQVMKGESNRDIEKTLFISHSTVKNHLYSIFQKAGVKSRSQLIHRVLHFEG
jgi:DNA-binding CsgD family transcriptional regulator